jgi:Cu(I)/Ag(I) efflux system membrane protein CusA/SilA
MLGSGTGSDVMQRIAAPMVGGMVTTTFLCLLVLPVIYGFVLNWRESRDAGPPERRPASVGRGTT